MSCGVTELYSCFDASAWKGKFQAVIYPVNNEHSLSGAKNLAHLYARNTTVGAGTGTKLAVKTVNQKEAMKTQKHNTILSALLVSALTTSALATRPVSPGESIQDAIDAAAVAPGADTILVGAGTYTECLTISDSDPLKLQGLGEVIIQCLEEEENAITVVGGRLTLENLTVTAGNDGVNATDMESLTLIRVTALGCGDEGLDAENVAMVSILDSLFRLNGDHGLKIENQGTGTVAIRNSHSLECAGDGVKVEDVAKLVVVGVVANDNDDGMDLDGIAEVEVRNSICNHNDDEGLEGDENGYVRVVATTCRQNHGEGIDLDDTLRIMVANVSCVENDANGFQAVAESIQTDEIAMSNSLFQANGQSGIELAEEDGTINEVVLNNIAATENEDSGLDIAISGTLIPHRVLSENNGDVDILP